MQASHPDLILIVDDNPTNLEVMSEALSDAGYEIAIATSGERAIQQIQRSQPDLILLDVMMAGIDGFETCQTIREELALTEIPIIFMTALADSENKVKGLELGAVDYITKPFQELEVLARVKTHLRLKRTEQDLRKSEERLESILNSLEEVVWSATSNPMKFLYLNPAVEEIFGHSTAELMDNSHLWFDMVHPNDKNLCEAAFQALDDQNSIELEYRIIDATGSIRWLKVRAHKVLEPANTSGYRIDGILHDISDRKRIETKLIHDAQHDNLTGLLNRNCFIAHINKRLRNWQNQPGKNFAILFIDLDRFKNINDSLGHHLGDQLLRQVAERLQKSIRPSDRIARLGGDEFTILLEEVTTADDAIRVAERIHHRLSGAIQIGEHILYTTGSIGIVMANNHYNSAEEMLRDADIAMYQSKKQGKSGWQLFNREMYQNSLLKLELERDLRLGIDRKEFVLYYQPLISLEDPNFVGFEALVRWIHPARGFVSPGDFIPIAEESGLITSLGEHLLWQACQQIRAWKDEFPGLSKLSLSVNLSSKQLQSANFLGTLDHIMTTTGISGEHLTLEITESALLHNSDSLLLLFHSLLERNITLSLDDFGTGYSSLSYLHCYPLNELKIDRSFVNRLETDQQSREIVRTITTLAKALDMKVVAEGVETQEQLNYIKSMSCDAVQGYFFSKPLPANQTNSWLAEHTATSPVLT